MARLCLYLLGPCYATLDGQPAPLEYDKVRALLAYLATERHQPVNRQRLAALLWPEQNQQAAHNGLRQALFRLRHALGDHTAEPPFLLIQRDTIQLNPAGDAWVDVLAFRQRLADCASHRHRSLATCPTCARLQDEAGELYRGNFLEQLSLRDTAEFEEWAVLKREQLRFAALEVLSRLAAYYERLGDYARVRGYAERQLALDSLNEAAHRQMLRALAASGQRGLALSHYEGVYRLMAQELGVEPARETVALYESLRKGAGSPAGDRPGAPALAEFLSVPAPLTPLVGREAELIELEAWLADPARRLITLAGPGGIGKTHLALAAIARQAAAFPDGVAFVPLAQAGAAEEVLPAVARALRFAFTDENVPEARLAEALRGRQVLLVLDSFEHVLAARPLLARLLAQVPGLVALVTSRERLNLAGEWVFEVGGLECPPPAGVEEIEAYSAVRLFVQTARQVRPDFGLLPADRPWVAAICRLTSGMPLALGLAAAWVRLLACQQIAEEIQHNLDVLAGAQGETSGRQASMRQIFDQSWGRLSEAEQRVFRQLAVFRGGFDQQAARDVLGADLQVLAGLMDKTFLQSTQAGRYDCHDLLRQYGAEKLAAAGEVEATRARHYAHFLRMAEANEGRLQQGPSLFGEFQEKFAAMFWLIREQANLQAALEWSLQGDPPRDAAGAQRLRAAMHQRWHGYGVHLLEW